MKTRTAFYLHASFLTRASRKLCQSLVPPRHIARSPFYPINIHAIKHECEYRFPLKSRDKVLPPVCLIWFHSFPIGQTQLAHKTVAELKELSKYKHRNRGSVTLTATRLAVAKKHDLVFPEWLAPTHKDKLPKTERVAFPKPPKGPGMLLRKILLSPEDKKNTL